MLEQLVNCFLKASHTSTDLGLPESYLRFFWPLPRLSPPSSLMKNFFVKNSFFLGEAGEAAAEEAEEEAEEEEAEEEEAEKEEAEEEAEKEAEEEEREITEIPAPKKS